MYIWKRWWLDSMTLVMQNRRIYVTQTYICITDICIGKTDVFM